jgi:hypothetical protein
MHTSSLAWDARRCCWGVVGKPIRGLAFLTIPYQDETAVALILRFTVTIAVTIAVTLAGIVVVVDALIHRFVVTSAVTIAVTIAGIVVVVDALIHRFVVTSAVTIAVTLAGIVVVVDALRVGNVAALIAVYTGCDIIEVSFVFVLGAIVMASVPFCLLMFNFKKFVV